MKSAMPFLCSAMLMIGSTCYGSSISQANEPFIQQMEEEIIKQNDSIQSEIDKWDFTGAYVYALYIAPRSFLEEIYINGKWEEIKLNKEFISKHPKLFHKQDLQEILEIYQDRSKKENEINRILGDMNKVWNQNSEVLKPLAKEYQKRLEKEIYIPSFAQTFLFRALCENSETNKVGHRIKFSLEPTEDQLKNIYNTLDLEFKPASDEEHIKTIYSGLESLELSELMENSYNFSDNINRRIHSKDLSKDWEKVTKIAEESVGTDTFYGKFSLMLKEKEKKGWENEKKRKEQYEQKKYSSVPELEPLEKKREILIEEASRLLLSKKDACKSLYKKVNSKIEEEKSKKTNLVNAYQLLLRVDENDNLQLEDSESSFLMNILGIESKSFDKEKAKKKLLNFDKIEHSEEIKKKIEDKTLSTQDQEMLDAFLKRTGSQMRK